MSQIINFISSLGAPFNMIVTICLIFALMAVAGAVTTMIGAIAKEIREYACHREDLQLKRELLDRGMGVEEVERLVRIQRSNPEP
jgi:hypothetical protein